MKAETPRSSTVWASSLWELSLINRCEGIRSIKTASSSDERDWAPMQLGNATFPSCRRLPGHRPVAGCPVAALSSLRMSGESVKTWHLQSPVGGALIASQYCSADAFRAEFVEMHCMKMAKNWQKAPKIEKCNVKWLPVRFRVWVQHTYLYICTGSMYLQSFMHVRQR